MQCYEGVDETGVDVGRPRPVVLGHRTEDEVCPARVVPPDDTPGRTDPAVALAQEAGPSRTTAGGDTWWFIP
ncbi:hypothetical protein GCM10010294_44440 [Streptomyces griseoloalbus]|nr:hypothetical protein GCM10010294_44440 [Streptomyces griseoloalbus]